MKKVYLAGQFSEYDNWKSSFRDVEGFDIFDPEKHSDQTSPDTFYPDDLTNVKESDILVASPGTIPCEGTWIEIGYFIATHTKKPGDFCDSLIIIWPEERIDWSMEFVQKAGIIVGSKDKALEELKKLK